MALDEMDGVGGLGGELSDMYPVDQTMLEGNAGGGKIEQDETADIENNENGDYQCESDDGLSNSFSNSGSSVSLSSLNKELAGITSSVGANKVDLAALPWSYRSLSSAEELLLAYVENFRRQFVQLYPNRKPLYLCPPNECGVEKFVCTIIRPTLLPYKDLYDHDGCAEFVANYLAYRKLDNPIDVPPLTSPTTTLRRQAGSSFDFSVVLVSLLIGAGYDAYVVWGYATREITEYDESRVECPLLKKEQEPEAPPPQTVTSTYITKEPRRLNSKFQMRMINKEKEAIVLKEKKEHMNAFDDNIKENVEDELKGLRLHCWVLVLAGKREVPEHFFIEPSSGQVYSYTHPVYLGIECVWNHTNYWVNMQDCSNGIVDMSYDLYNASCWEYLFPENSRNTTAIGISGSSGRDDLLTSPEPEDDDDDVLDLPPSWVDKITLTPTEFQMRCPNGVKTIIYKRCVLDKFAPYVREDGMVSRLTVFEDSTNTTVLEIQELFENRRDLLLERIRTLKSGRIHERYMPGQPNGLKDHYFYDEEADVDGSSLSRVIHFYAEARLDGLETREYAESRVTETFSNRDDRLHYRSARFETGDDNERRVVKMTEKFHRSPNLSANEDVAARVFYLSDGDRVQLVFHLEEARITASTREYFQPRTGDKIGSLEVKSFQVDPEAKPLKKQHFHADMARLMAAKMACLKNVQESERETSDIIKLRAREESAIQLTVSFYDTMRNKSGKALRDEKEINNEEDQGEAPEIDYLAPFLAQLDLDDDEIDQEDAQWLREEALKDLKQRLIEKAGLIQSRFDQVTDSLQHRQMWYQQNQGALDAAEEEEYVHQCNEAMFRLHILEQRLNRHKDLAPRTYVELDHKLRRDPRLSQLYID